MKSAVTPALSMSPAQCQPNVDTRTHASLWCFRATSKGVVTRWARCRPSYGCGKHLGWKRRGHVGVWHCFGAWFGDNSVLPGGSSDSEGPFLLLIPLLSRPGSLHTASVITSSSALLMHSQPVCWQPGVGVYLENLASENHITKIGDLRVKLSKDCLKILNTAVIRVKL